MYTRCPSCRAEICFEPPANAANLPDGYKHRIKCPSCGVTIGVKLPNRDAIASVQPTFTPANPNAFSSEPIYSAAPYTPSAEDEKAAKKEARKAAAATKKSGLSRNITVFVFSALFIVCAVLGYLYTQGTVDNGILSGFAYFDGVSVLKSIAQEPELYQAMFEADVATGFITVLPVIFFLGSVHDNRGRRIPHRRARRHRRVALDSVAHLPQKHEKESRINETPLTERRFFHSSRLPERQPLSLFRRFVVLSVSSVPPATPSFDNCRYDGFSVFCSVSLLTRAAHASRAHIST